MSEKHLMLLQHIVNYCNTVENSIKQCNYGIACDVLASFRMDAIEHLDKAGYEMDGCIIRKKKAAE